MCGIFGVVSDINVIKSEVKLLAKQSRARGKDSSGLVIYNNTYSIIKNNQDILFTLKSANWHKSKIVLGHSRLITNGLYDNQPVTRNGITLIHNGIIVDEEATWKTISNVKRMYEIDSELIIAVAHDYVNRNKSTQGVIEEIFDKCKGSISALLLFHEYGELFALSNTGSMYFSTKNNTTYFSSERFPLQKLKLDNITQIKNSYKKLVVPISGVKITREDNTLRETNLIPKLASNDDEKSLLIFGEVNLKRCTKCILPETMPFIDFDHEGVCNYCRSYEPKNHRKSLEKLKELVAPYSMQNSPNVLVPLSGGRDSCYTLHLAVKELGLKPITFTYEWGMVTDLARRNISRICSQLGVENIIIAADTELKRSNIRKNLLAWLEKPHLGMVNLLMAGDKHFFKYNEIVKKQNNVNLELWGVNSLEKTHFKTGFLGLPPLLKHDSYYVTDKRYQLIYQWLRFKEYLRNTKYLNSSLWDTFTGEYYRSIRKKHDYYHVFDYMTWDENVVNETLKEYGFEMATDTKSSWRIGDGTAAFYNYIYYTIAGFSEHDTFRSNQIREGLITRDKALALVKDENKPRYENIKWYLDTLGLDFSFVINKINMIQKLY